MTRNAARSVAVTLALAVALSLLGTAQHVTLPLAKDSTRFAVIGDTGTGDKPQYEIGRKLEDYRQHANFTFTIMVGDNIYGSERPQDFQKKFEMPYKPLLDAGVQFYAALGNHDDPNQRFYKPFNMNGERFYTFTKGNIDFFVLDSNYMDRKQLDWFERAIKDSKSDWKMAYFHHPLYSSGAAHGSETDLRTVLEPLFVTVRDGRRICRPRAFLRACQTTEGHLLLHVWRVSEAPQGRHPEGIGADGKGRRHREYVHGRRSGERRVQLPDRVTRRRHDRLGRLPAHTSLAGRGESLARPASSPS